MFVAFLFLFITRALAAGSDGSLLHRLHMEEVTSSSEDNPCQLKFSGPWADAINITISPNPPSQSGINKFAADCDFKADTLALTYTANMTLEGSGVVFRKEATICGMGTTNKLCPARKGETRHIEKLYSISSLPKGVYSAIAEIFNQDGKEILTFVLNNCTLS